MTSVEYVEKSRLDEAEARLKIARKALEGIRNMDLYSQNVSFGGETDADRFHAATARARHALKLMDHPDAG